MYKQILLFSVMLSLSLSIAAKDSAGTEVKYLKPIKKEVLLDPTRPLGYVKDKTQVALTLQAIYFGQGRKEAVINGKLVKEGDFVNGKRVVAIAATKVIYEASGVQKALVLRPSIFK